MSIRCPNAQCGASNNFPVITCRNCGADLRAYAVALKWPDYCFNRALDCARKGRYAEAWGQIQLCLTLRPGDEEAALLAGKIKHALGDKREARRMLHGLVTSATDSDIRTQAEQCCSATGPVGGSSRRRGKKRRKKKRKGE